MGFYFGTQFTRNRYSLAFPIIAFGVDCVGCSLPNCGFFCLGGYAEGLIGVVVVEEVYT
jgi:hypothetical protein